MLCYSIKAVRIISLGWVDPERKKPHKTHTTVSAVSASIAIILLLLQHWVHLLLYI